MRVSDQHIHSACSPDSHADIRGMAQAALSHGMSMVCFTDHIDLDVPATGHADPEALAPWPRNRAVCTALRDAPPPGIEVRFGVELGEPHHDPARAARVAAEPTLDFVLGSLHNLRDTPDFYLYPYKDAAECRRLNQAYLLELLELAALDCFDVMAHIGYTSRYMQRDGFPCEVTPEEYPEELRALFTRLIQRGKGLEVNVSGLRCGQGSYPNAASLTLYRQLGGELVTVGSDAHRFEDAGVGVRQGYGLLRELGFRYVTEYRRRRAAFLPLDMKWEDTL